MKKLLTMLVRIAMLLALCLGITLLATQLVKVWREFVQSTPAPGEPMFAPVGAPGHTEVSKPEPATYQSNRELDWTREELHELRRSLDNLAMQQLMEMFRDRDSQAVNFNEIMAATGRTMSQVRADLSMLSRKSHLVDDHSDWPLDTAVPTDGESNRAYSIPPQYIEWWFEE